MKLEFKRLPEIDCSESIAHNTGDPENSRPRESE